jgi:hypothetical protein
MVRSLPIMSCGLTSRGRSIHCIIWSSFVLSETLFFRVDLLVCSHIVSKLLRSPSKEQSRMKLIRWLSLEGQAWDHYCWIPNMNKNTTTTDHIKFAVITPELSAVSHICKRNCQVQGRAYAKEATDGLSKPPG